MLRFEKYFYIAQNEDSKTFKRYSQVVFGDFAFLKFLRGKMFRAECLNQSEIFLLHCSQSFPTIAFLIIILFLETRSFCNSKSFLVESEMRPMDYTKMLFNRWDRFKILGYVKNHKSAQFSDRKRESYAKFLNLITLIWFKVLKILF